MPAIIGDNINIESKKGRSEYSFERSGAYKRGIMRGG